MPKRGVWEWLWRSAALASARERTRHTGVRRERLRRAQLAAELGDRAFEPGDPLRTGSGLPLALSLYREAAYWGLMAYGDGPALADLREAFAAVPDLSALSGLSADDVAQVRAALVDKTFIDSADERSELQTRSAELGQRFVRGVIDNNPARDDQVANALLERALRCGTALAVILVAAFAIRLGVERALRGPDLALDKPWRASSQAFVCHPKQTECGGAQTAILFHTVEEDSPWFEIDLGAVEQVARLEVINREDCCQERAVPLVVEVSDDRKHWTQVARREDTFRSWEATFAPVKTRYVRLRVERRSLLHLLSVSVHPH